MNDNKSKKIGDYAYGTLNGALIATQTILLIPTTLRISKEANPNEEVSIDSLAETMFDPTSSYYQQLRERIYEHPDFILGGIISAVTMGTLLRDNLEYLLFPLATNMLSGIFEVGRKIYLNKTNR